MADYGRVLPRSFYAREVTAVARGLLGCVLVHDGLCGRIVETEAYGGPGDPGSHAHRAPNGRARLMFGPPGVAYVYFTYGMHHCLNAVTGPPAAASAVLIRALEPVTQLPGALPPHKRAAGPGRLCKALGITAALNGTDLVNGPVTIRRAPAPPVTGSGPRIGLSSDDGRLWRFWTPSRSLSRPV